MMPRTDPSGDWETIVAGAPIDTITPVKSIRVWADGGTLTFTDEGLKTTTAMPVLASEIVPIYGRLTDVSSTVTISLLR